MSKLLLNLDELNSRHERSDEIRTRTFDDILLKCHSKIKKYNNEFKKHECTFTPPLFVVGKPPYNYYDLVYYIISSLRKNGVRAEWFPQNNTVYISWKRNDVDLQQYQTHFSEAMYSTSVPANDMDTHKMSIMQVNTPPKPTTKRKPKDVKRPVQHVAMLEYHPGIKDYIPVNITGIK